MGDKVITAFQPIIDLIQGIAFPLAFVAIGTGICLLIIGQKSHGMKAIKYAAIGYIMMQWLPGIMSMLRDVGKAMK